MFETKKVNKSFDTKEKKVNVLTDLDFNLGDGMFAGIFGASGSGKSTFLHILGGLDRPDSGEVLFDGINIYKKNDNKIAEFRNKIVGFVFQFYHLLPEFTALENVMLPALISGMSFKEAKKLALEAVSVLEMGDRSSHRPNELSGGEQQRIAIARAIIMKPRFLLADEPTGNLDEHTGNKIFSYLELLNRERKMGIVMVTHNPELLKRIPNRFELKDGALK